MLILGIETSCDETAIALVEDGRRIHANVVASQIELHARWGGIVPEVAARQHVLAFEPALRRALSQAGAGFSDIDLIAATHEPGLIGALLVGVSYAKGLSLASRIPLLGIHHLEGHVYANWLTDEGGVRSDSDPARPTGAEPEFPLVCLIVSGGHSEIVLMTEHGTFEPLGTTRDDAAGEAFDKVARLLGLGFPGGPEIERAAQRGDPGAFPVPRAWLGKSFDFSFSGMKSAMARLVEPMSETTLRAAAPDLAAAFQEAMIEIMVTKTLRAADQVGARQIVLSGGVAANRALKRRFDTESSLPVLCPPPLHCTDNGATIASCAYFRHIAGATGDLALDVRSVAPIA